MARLLTSRVITYEVSIDEAQVRERLIEEALEQLGLPVKPAERPKGMMANCLRGEGGKGGYRVRITRDLDKEDTPKIEGPR